MKKSDILDLDKETRKYFEAEIDAREVMKGFARAAREKGIDWAQFKRLAKARIEDARDGTDERVTALIEKADFAASYADMLGFGSKMNTFEKTCSSENAPAPPQKPVERPAAPVVITPSKAENDFPAMPAFLERAAQ